MWAGGNLYYTLNDWQGTTVIECLLGQIAPIEGKFREINARHS